MNVLLIGYRGTGKTTVARRLAELLGWRHVDTDDLIEQRAGKSIANIFADEGEPAFRDLEGTVVEDASKLARHVIALGGGAILRDANREAIQNAGPVVWLTATPTTIAERIGGDPTTGARRPNLTSAGGRPEIERLLAEREPLYRQCATIVVDTENSEPDAIARSILDRLDLEPEPSAAA